MVVALVAVLHCMDFSVARHVSNLIRVKHVVQRKRQVSAFCAGLRAGGKDSTVLAHMMTVLNERHGYGLDLFLLSIDEGISGYRDDSLETVKRNEAQCVPREGPEPAAAFVLLMHRLPDPQAVRRGGSASNLLIYGTGCGSRDILLVMGLVSEHSPQVSCVPCFTHEAGCKGIPVDPVRRYGIPLTVLSYKALYGWTMDEIVAAIGHRNNCTFCGVFRRQALDRGAALMRADKLATGALQGLLRLSADITCIETKQPWAAGTPR